MSQGMSGGGTDEPIDDHGPIYLDHNATTPLDPRVLEAMVRVWRDCGANPASQHAAGRAARRLVEEAREGILALLGGRTSGMSTDRLIFTSGGTEANNLALQNWGASHLALSPLEHPSIQATAARLSQALFPEGVHFRLERLPVLPNGKVDLTVIDMMAQRSSESQRPALISVMLASNETGVLQPVREICQLVENRGMLVHSDAVQAVGKVPVHFRELGVHAMTVAPHKFHGPLGIGALVVRSRVQLQPQLVGGFQQESLRAGTECAALAVGFHRALALAHEESTTRWARMRELRDDFECVLRKELPTIVIIGEDVPRLPHTSCISFPPLERQALVMALDLAGVACSTGSACASGSSEPSPTLVTMGLPPAVVGSAIRFSLGAFTTAAEVHSATERIIKTVNRLRPAR